MSDNPAERPNPPARQQHEERRHTERAGKHDELVDKWWNECVRGTAVSRNVDVHNDLFHAIVELKKRLNRVER